LNFLLSQTPLRLLTGFLLLLAAISCKKEPYEIGYDLLPPSDTLNVITTDTCTVEAFSELHDSVRTDKTSYLTMGSLLDPVFGKTTVGFYSQIRLSSEEVDFGDNPVLDSAVLMLFYKDYYGDTLTRQRVKVYEISGDFSYDSIYYSTSRIAAYPTLLADQDFIPRPSDSVVVGRDTLAPHLRINLSNLTHYFGTKILSAPDDALASISAFNKFLRGLYVAPDPVSAGGALLNFDITSGMSKVVLYFRNAAADSLEYDLWLNQGCARFLAVDHHGYLQASQDVKRQVLNNDSAQGMNRIFLQGMGGVRVKLKFPYIANLAPGKIIAINDAVLQVKNTENDTILAPPPSLTIMRVDSIGRVGYLVDENEGTSYFGGIYNPSSTGGTYSFRVTQHLQNILQNAYPNHFDLYIMLNSPLASLATPNRVQLYGYRPQNPADEGNRIRLKLTYTILNE